MRLDRVDIGILSALQEDARLSFRDLSRRVGVSVPTISARVENLRNLGILTGFHASVDPERLGQRRVVLVVGCARGKADAVGAALASLTEVRWTVRTSGSRIIAEAVLPKTAPLDRFLSKVASLDGVTSCAHHTAAKALKDEPRAVIAEGVSATVDCFECGQPIEGRPLRIRLDGRYHYLCCPSCERLYRERYGRIRAGVSPTPQRPRRAASV